MKNTNQKMKFDIEPDDIEPMLSLSFEYEHGQELDDEECYWQRDKLLMAKELEKAIIVDCKLDLADTFNAFFNNPDNEVQLFIDLEIQLNAAGFFTYNSDTRFHIYEASDVVLTDEYIIECLAG